MLLRFKVLLRIVVRATLNIHPHIPYIHPQRKNPKYTLKVNTYILVHPHNPHKPNLINVKKFGNFFDQGVHDHDVLVDLVHIPEGGSKIVISQKLELCGANEVDIRNQ